MKVWEHLWWGRRERGTMGYVRLRREVDLTGAAARSSLGFTRQAPFIRNPIFIPPYPANISIHPLSQRKLIVRSCPLFTEEKGKNDIASCSEIYQEILEEKIKSKINQNLKEPDFRAEAWKEPCPPSPPMGRRDTQKRGLNSQEASTSPWPGRFCTGRFFRTT